MGAMVDRYLNKMRLISATTVSGKELVSDWMVTCSHVLPKLS